MLVDGSSASRARVVQPCSCCLEVSFFSACLSSVSTATASRALMGFAGLRAFCQGAPSWTRGALGNAGAEQKSVFVVSRFGASSGTLSKQQACSQPMLLRGVNLTRLSTASVKPVVLTTDKCGIESAKCYAREMDTIACTGSAVTVLKNVWFCKGIKGHISNLFALVQSPNVSEYNDMC